MLVEYNYNFPPPLNEGVAIRNTIRYKADYKFYLRCYRVLIKRQKTKLIKEIESEMKLAHAGFNYYAGFLRRAREWEEV